METAFICEFCGKVCAKSDQLTNHERFCAKNLASRVKTYLEKFDDVKAEQEEFCEKMAQKVYKMKQRCIEMEKTMKEIQNKNEPERNIQIELEEMKEERRKDRQKSTIHTMQFEAYLETDIKNKTNFLSSFVKINTSHVE